MTQLKESGEELYPHKFTVTTSIPDCIDKYSSLEKGVKLDDVTLSVAGMLTTKYLQ